MKAIVQDRYGSPDVLALRDVDKPEPAADELLIRIHAASVNARDWHVMRGQPSIARLMMPSVFGRRGPRKPIRGSDFAGRVEAVGSNVTRLRPGDEVYGDLGAQDGAFAEFVCAPEHLVERKPANLTFEQAAAMPLAGNTALMELRDAAGVQPGDRVLINGASGGVGTFAVQIAKFLGADVTGLCSTRNIDLIASIGADRIIDYTQTDFASGDQQYDVILDLVGNRSLSDCRRALTPNGTLILSGGGAPGTDALVGPVGLIIRGQLMSPFVKQRLIAATATPSSAMLVALRELAESGAVTPVIDRTFPLSQVPDAIRYVEVEHARAKVVISVA